MPQPRAASVLQSQVLLLTFPPIRARASWGCLSWQGPGTWKAPCDLTRHKEVAEAIANAGNKECPSLPDSAVFHATKGKC